MSDHELLARVIFGVPVKATDTHRLKEALDALIDGLPIGQSRFHSRNRAVIRARYGLDGEPKTLVEIGLELGVSSERVRQIEVKALRMLRHPSRSRQLAQCIVVRHTATATGQTPRQRS